MEQQQQQQPSLLSSSSAIMTSSLRVDFDNDNNNKNNNNDITTEAELLSRLQSQFGDMDLTLLLDDDKKDDKKDDEETSNDDEESSSLHEPTPEELQAWQEAQFQKGQQESEGKKLFDRMTPSSLLQQRRRERQRRRREQEQDDDEDWEQVPAIPQLDKPSFFFPNNNNNNSDDAAGDAGAGNIHPLLLDLASAEPDILGNNSQWKRLYSSAHGDGLSFSILLDTIKGYDGPTVMLISGHASTKHCIHGSGSNNNSSSNSSSTMGFFTTSPWMESVDFFGTNDCFLFTCDYKENEIHIIRPIDEQEQEKNTTTTKSGGKNYMYCHPSSFKHHVNNNNKNRQRSATTTTSTTTTDGYSYVHGIGVGGTVSQPRLHLTETLEECRAMEHCMTFSSHPLLLGDGNNESSLYYFDTDCIEVWGVGGTEWIQHGLEAQQKERQMAEATLKRARQVLDKKQFVDDLRLLSGTTTKSSGLFQHTHETLL